MKASYKIPIIVVCMFTGWVLFPNIPGAICHFAYSGGTINDKGMYEPEFCSITGVNFFGHSLDTNFFHEEIKTGIFGGCYYENNGEIKICGMR